MGTSITLFRIHGIDINVHWSFLLVLVYGAIAFGGRSDSLVVSALYGVLVTLLLFVCVTLHEFGHAAVAKHYRIEVPSITLLPIGGLANLEKIPEKPIQEFFIAVAGPAVNFLLAALLVPVALLIAGAQVSMGSPLPSISGLQRDMLEPGLLNIVIYLISTNLLLALFNLLPAFPMDGGRILRALLATILSYVTATRIAVYVGRAMAVLFAVWGMFGGGIFLLFIAFFVYVGGGAEREAVEHRAILRNVPVTRALRPPAVTLYTSETIGRAADLVMQHYQADYPVRDLSGHFVGVLTRPALVKALREGGREVRVIDVVTPLRAIPVCTLDDDLSVVWERMMQSKGRVVVVMDDEQLLGLVTVDSISEVMQIIGAANSRPAGQGKDQRSGGPWDEGERNNSHWIDGQRRDDRRRDDRSSSML